MGERLLTFGEFTLDNERKLLLKAGAAVPMSHRAVSLLAALIEAGGRVMSKGDLMDIAWPGQSVEESNLSVQIAALRKGLGTRPDGEEWITTVPRIGYQFLAPEDPPHRRPPTVSGPVDTRPSLAVLPFANLSASQENEFFADGMTDDIIAALSRVGDLFVASRSSSQALKGKGLSAKDAARELGVRYLLEGSIRAAHKQVRVAAQLTDGDSGTAVWAERYDGTLEDIFAFQDDLTRSIAQALQITLSTGEGARLWEGQTRNLRAWEKTVQGLRAFRRFTTADNATARQLFEEAIALDPQYTGAMVWLTISHHWDARYSLSVNRSEASARADRSIAAIVAVNPALPQLNTLRSYSAFLRLDYDMAVSLGREAVSRAPNDSRTHGFLGTFQIYAGELQDALVSFSHAMRHNPHPEVYLLYYTAIIHMWLENRDKALALAVENERLEPGEPYSAAVVAAVHGFRGELHEARAAIARLCEATPSFSLRNIRHSELYRNPGYLDRLCEILRGAGLPD